MTKDIAFPGPEVPVIDESRLAAEFGSDPEILAELRDLFLEHIPPLFQEIQEALNTGDAATLAINSHSLKGASATYGAPRLAMVCKEFEMLAKAGDLETIRIHLGKLDEEYQKVRLELGSLEVS